MQFADKSETASKRKQSLIRVSHEIRTRLNSMLGFLRLLIDDMADNSQERQELIEESYKSALRILNTLDVFDDIVSLQKNWQFSATEENNGVAPGHETLKVVTEDLRTNLNPMLGSLRSLADNLVDTPQKQNQILSEAYHYAMHLLDKLEHFEDSVKV
jgi:subfamily B ATP-binding cassette protein MsbA